MECWYEIFSSTVSILPHPLPGSPLFGSPAQGQDSIVAQSTIGHSADVEECCIVRLCDERPSYKHPWFRLGHLGGVHAVADPLISLLREWNEYHSMLILVTHTGWINRIMTRYRTIFDRTLRYMITCYRMTWHRTICYRVACYYTTCHHTTCYSYDMISYLTVSRRRAITWSVNACNIINGVMSPQRDKRNLHLCNTTVVLFRVLIKVAGPGLTCVYLARYLEVQMTTE